MTKVSITFRNIIAVAALFFISASTFASDIPDPEILLKQYLKDLCTLNEQDFTRKYMLTQVDADDFIKNVNSAYLGANEKPSEKFSDSLAIRSAVHSLIIKSYRSFKEWQHENNIDSSKIKYHSCEFELEKRRKMPYYAIDKGQIYFLYDTLRYAIACDDFLFLNTKWVGGEIDGINELNKYFKKIYYDYEEYDYVTDAAVAADTTVLADAYDYEEYSEVVETEVAYSKKDLKIQKKIDAYYRKIDKLYMKKHA
jgi:hypothetical protein